MRLLRVDAMGKIAEIGHFQPPGAETSAAYWITCNLLYTVDYSRGIDIVRVNDPASACADPDALRGEPEGHGPLPSAAHGRVRRVCGSRRRFAIHVRRPHGRVARAKLGAAIVSGLGNGIEHRVTARLLLRRIVPEDVPALAAITADAHTNLHRPGGAPSLLESRQIVRDCIRGWEQDGIGYWVVEHAGAVVGIAGVRPFELADRVCWNLYYRFAPAAWGKGLATEAAREAVVVARGVPPGRPVVARTRTGNAAAVKVAEAAGLTRRPELDYDGFAVLAVGWPQPAEGQSVMSRSTRSNE